MSEKTALGALHFAPWFPGVDRRASLRLPAALRACYRVLGVDGAAARVRVRNLSALGVGLAITHPIGPGTLLHIAFERPAGETVCCAMGRVVHVTMEAGGLVGCAFVRELGDAVLRLFDAQRLPATAGDCRRWVRFSCNVETAYYVADAAPGERSPARIVNISAGGMGLMLPCEFSTGTLLKLDLEGTLARAAGPVLLRVVRASARRDRDWLLGCEFAHQLSDEELQALLEEA